MKKTGAWLVRFALEQIGTRFTFGIPGVHNTELYDELHASRQIRPWLVTHEGAGAFMADGMSRTSTLTGTLMLVPAAGLTHAASGIGEAFLDGIPMLVISGGVRTDTQYHYQLHDLDAQALMAPLCKATFRITRHAEIVEVIYKAFDLAHAGEPGPVYVEVPVNLQLDEGDIHHLPPYKAPAAARLDRHGILKAAELLKHARKPGIFLGWGAVGAADHAIAIAEQLMAPVATTLQGLSAFPGDHPLFAGMSFGPHAVPSAQVMQECDVLLAVGTRFGEIATGSYGMPVPRQLIHIDINPNVFHANYPATVTIQGDSRQVMKVLHEQLGHMEVGARQDGFRVRERIAAGRSQLIQSWLEHDSQGRVSPYLLFKAIEQRLDADAYIVTDDGNHTFLTAELLTIRKPRHFISPTDFNCMGYAVPAALGVKLAHPQSTVLAIVGDGAFNMTCMELLTASQQGLGVIVVIFADGELAQIAQAQASPYRRTTCTQLPGIDREALAKALGTAYVAIAEHASMDAALDQAIEQARAGRPVLVDVRIDYSKPTCFTQGVMKTSLKRMQRRTQVRLVSRSLWRKLAQRVGSSAE